MLSFTTRHIIVSTIHYGIMFDPSTVYDKRLCNRKANKIFHKKYIDNSLLLKQKEANPSNPTINTQTRNTESPYLCYKQKLIPVSSSTPVHLSTNHINWHNFFRFLSSQTLSDRAITWTYAATQRTSSSIVDRICCQGAHIR